MKMHVKIGCSLAVLLSGVVACSPARTAFQDGVEQVVALMTDSELGVIERGDEFLYNEKNSFDASVNLARAVLKNGLVSVSSQERAQADPALNEAAYQLLEDAFAVRRWQLHKVRVPQEILAFGAACGQRFVLVTAHDGYVRTEQNFIMRSAQASGAGMVADISMTTMTHTRSTYVRPTTPVKEFSDLHVALVDTQKRLVLFAKESMENKDPVLDVTIVKQVRDVLLDYFR